MMRIKTLILVALLSGGFLSHAQNLSVASIPPALKKGADVVIRYSEETMDFSGVEDIVYREKAAYTIFNDDGEQWASFAQYYDQMSKLRGIKIMYYDANGKVIKKVKSGEIEDVNITSSGSVFDDNRIKYYEPDGFDYPFTAAFEYEMILSTSFQLSPFKPQRSSGVAVQYASYRATVPSGYELRFKELNDIAPVVKSQDAGTTTYSWKIENEKALKREYAGESVSSMSKGVLLAPSEFSMAGYKGDMSTWEGLGKWQLALNEGRDELPQEVKNEVLDLVSGVDDDVEKVRRIYNYLQTNTRYVSIQLGIGGWQPFPAVSVAENGYGDCKALSNYTASLLKLAGIKSNYVVIKAGAREDDLVLDFPSNQFNHAILAVPMEKDTLWLECTSQEAPFNFLGGFTSDRHALMITEEGGVVVKTPEYTVEENAQLRNARVVFDAEGNATASVETVYKGRQYDDNYRISKKGKDDQRKRLLNTIDIPAFDLGTFAYAEDKSSTPQLTETYNLDLRKYGSTTGNRLFFTPNMLNRPGLVPPKDEKRLSPIIRRYNYMDIDTIVYKLPENYRLEFQPEPVEINSEFGEYRLSYEVNPDTNEMTYVRYIKVFKGKYPANAYGDFRNFWRKVTRADKSKLVLIGNT